MLVSSTVVYSNLFSVLFRIDLALTEPMYKFWNHYPGSSASLLQDSQTRDQKVFSLRGEKEVSSSSDLLVLSLYE